MAAVLPQSRVNRVLKPSNCFEVYSYSRSWPCLLPQRGPGAKHQRRIWLADWQQRLAERWPAALLRGLIHSDGWRSLNSRGRRGGTWTAPRYGFGNFSSDVTSIFCSACDRVGLRWTAAFPSSENRQVTIYVAPLRRRQGWTASSGRSAEPQTRPQV